MTYDLSGNNKRNNMIMSCPICEGQGLTSFLKKHDLTYRNAKIKDLEYIEE